MFCNIEWPHAFISMKRNRIMAPKFQFSNIQLVAFFGVRFKANETSRIAIYIPLRFKTAPGADIHDGQRGGSKTPARTICLVNRGEGFTLFVTIDIFPRLDFKKL